jgi:hypothetical protein
MTTLSLRRALPPGAWCQEFSADSKNHEIDIQCNSFTSTGRNKIMQIGIPPRRASRLNASGSERLHRAHGRKPDYPILIGKGDVILCKLTTPLLCRGACQHIDRANLDDSRLIEAIDHLVLKPEYESRSERISDN